MCHSIKFNTLRDAVPGTGIADADAPAVQLGVGAGGGVDPASLRAALSQAMPESHVVLTWARSGLRSAMDVYVMPAALMRRGLVAVAKDQLAAAARSDAVAASTFDPEVYTNEIKTAESETKNVSV